MSLNDSGDDATRKNELLSSSSLTAPATNREITEAVISTLQGEFNEALDRFIDALRKGTFEGEYIAAVLFCLYKEQMNAGMFEQFLADIDSIPDSEAKGITEKALHYYIKQSPHAIPSEVRIIFKQYRTQIVYTIEMLKKDYRGELSAPEVAEWVRCLGGLEALYKEWNRELTRRSRKAAADARDAQDAKDKEDADKAAKTMRDAAAAAGISVGELQLRRQHEKAQEIKTAKDKLNAAVLRKLFDGGLPDDGQDGLLVRIDGVTRKLNPQHTMVVINCASALT